jgi:hypothetical protein
MTTTIASTVNDCRCTYTQIGCKSGECRGQFEGARFRVQGAGCRGWKKRRLVVSAPPQGREARRADISFSIGSLSEIAFRCTPKLLCAIREQLCRFRGFFFGIIALKEKSSGAGFRVYWHHLVVSAPPQGREARRADISFSIGSLSELAFRCTPKLLCAIDEQLCRFRGFFFGIIALKEKSSGGGAIRNLDHIVRFRIGFPQVLRSSELDPINQHIYT